MISHSHVSLPEGGKNWVPHFTKTPSPFPADLYNSIQAVQPVPHLMNVPVWITQRMSLNACLLSLQHSEKHWKTNMEPAVLCCTHRRSAIHLPALGAVSLDSTESHFRTWYFHALSRFEWLLYEWLPHYALAGPCWTPKSPVCFPQPNSLQGSSGTCAHHRCRCSNMNSQGHGQTSTQLWLPPVGISGPWHEWIH